MTRSTLSCLKEIKWLKDDVLDAYMALLQQRSASSSKKHKFFPTHFYQLISAENYHIRTGLQYVRDEDILEWDFLYIPINVNENHWVLVMVDLQGGRLFPMDPLGGNLKTETAYVKRFLDDLVQLRKPTMPKPWGRVMLHGIPTQGDNYNCGVYVLLYAELLSRPAKFIIDPLSLRYMRQRIVVDLITSKIVREDALGLSPTCLPHPGIAQ